MTLQERFWSKVAQVGNVCECWNWTATHARGGYGSFHLGDRMVMAHRIAYELSIGEIPPGLDIDHLCSNRGCCNPYHLEPVTHAENIRRGETGIVNLSKTHCPQGHEYSGENLFIRKHGGRECRTCMRAQLRRSRARARERQA